MSGDVKGEIVNQTGLGRVFGVHRNTVAAWVRKGCPFLTKGDNKLGRDWEFDTAQVAQWREELAAVQAVGDTATAPKEELLRRKLAAETTISELEAGKARGELASLDELGRQVTNAVIEMRQRMLQIPARAAAVIVGAADEREAKKILSEEIEEALAAISDEFGD